MQQTKIDYRALDNLKSSFEEISAKLFGFGLLAFVLIAMVLIGLNQSGFLSIDEAVGIGTMFYVIFMFIVVVIVMFVSILSFQNRKHNTEALTSFANANRWQYSEKLEFDGGYKAGSLFQHGHSKSLNCKIDGKLLGLPFALFTYKYSTGSGKNESDYESQVMELKLPRKLPHMIIDSLVEDGENSRSTLPINFAKSQKISLEGDFHKYFDLYAPDKYGITALTILAPDAMEALMHHAALCDIEIIDNKLYFYWPATPEKRSDYEEIFKTVEEVLEQTGGKLIKDDVFATYSQAQIHSSQTVQGARLKRSYVPQILSGIVSVGVFVLYYFPSIFPADVTLISIMIVAGFAAGGLIYAGIKANKRRKLRDQLRRYQYRS